RLATKCPSSALNWILGELSPSIPIVMRGRPSLSTITSFSASMVVGPFRLAIGASINGFWFRTGRNLCNRLRLPKNCTPRYPIDDDPASARRVGHSVLAVSVDLRQLKFEPSCLSCFLTLAVL